MVAYQGRTLAQVRNSIQRKIRTTDSASGTYDLQTGVDRAINDAIHDLTSRTLFDWTIREFWFDTVPPVAAASTQAVSVQAGSDHVTGSGTVFTAGMVGSILFVAGGRVPYEIYTVSPSQDTARIVVGFEGTTNQTAASFRVVRDSFTLSAAKSAEATDGSRVRLIRAMVLESGTSRWPMVQVGARDWDRRYPRVANESRPYYYTMIRYTADGVARIRFWPIPNDRYVIRFTAYCWLPELTQGTDVMEVPGTADRVVEDIAYARCLTDLLHDSGPHVEAAMARAQSGLDMLVRDNMTNPDLDLMRGDSPYSSRGLPVIMFPPDFGHPVEIGG